MTTKLTALGVNVMTRALDGDTITFTHIQLGNGAAQIAADTEALNNPLLTLEIDEIKVEDRKAALSVSFQNSQLDAGFRWTEVGIFCRDPDDSSAELLYAYGYEPEETADYIAASDDQIQEMQLQFLAYVSDANNNPALINQSTVYAAKADFDTHLADHANPHTVTKEQVGLGNVPNLAPEDMVPPYTEPAGDALIQPQSGNTISTFFGRVSKAVRALISHLADNVRHVSATERNTWNSKANASHSHSTADITSGTLGVGRGGTGKSLWSSGGLIYASSVDQLAQVSPPAANNMVLFGRSNGAPAWQRISYSGTYTGSGRTGAPYDTSITIAYAGDPKMLLIMKVGSTCFGQFMFSGNAATGMTYVDEQWIPMHCSWSDEGPNVVIEWRNAREIEYAIPASQLDEAGAIYIYTVLF